MVFFLELLSVIPGMSGWIHLDEKDLLLSEIFLNYQFLPVKFRLPVLIKQLL